MAITNLGLSFEQSGSDSDNSVRIAPSTSSPVYIKWKTDRGAERLASFDIAVLYRCVPRGEAGYGDWTDATIWENVAASECNAHQVSGESGWWWSHALDIDDLLSRIAPNGWSFAERTCDEINVELRIKARYVSGFTDQYGRTYSARTDAKAWVGYTPDYVLTSAYIGASGDLNIEYSVSDWERTDDRWCLQWLAYDGYDVAVGTPWGYCDKGNRIVIPASKLKLIPPERSEVSALVRFNAAYKPQGSSICVANQTLTVEDRSTANRPNATVVSDGTSVSVTVSDSGNLGVPLTGAIVKLAGGEYSFDTQEVAVGETAAFPYVPLGEELTFYVVGYGADSISKVVTVTADAIDSKGKDLVETLDGSAAAYVRFNPKRSWKGSREMEVEKLAGRDAPSVFYGRGRTATQELSGIIVDRDNAPVERQRVSEFKALASAGVVMARSHDGERMLAAVTSVGLSKAYDSPATNVTISMAEVAE